MASEIKSKNTDTKGFTATPEFDRLTKASFDARIKKVAKKPGKERSI